MKKETKTTVQENSLNKKSKKETIQVFSIRHFYNLFTNGKKSKIKKVSFVVFQKIIHNYLSVYFHDLYINNRVMYFFFGGQLKLVKYNGWINNQTRGKSKNKSLHRVQDSIGLFWFMRPSQRFYYMVELKKLTGSTNALPKIEKLFSQISNKDLLPIFNNEIEKAKSDKTLYQCTPT